MKRLSSLTLILFFLWVGQSYAAYIERADCGELTSPVVTVAPNKVTCKQTTSVSGRIAGQIYNWTGTVWEAMGGGTGTFDGDASDVPFTPVSNIAAGDVQAAIAEVNAERQPLSTNLTEIAALTDGTDSECLGWTSGGIVSKNCTAGIGADLTAIEALTGTGFPARTADNTWALRNITGTSNKISITNPAGVAGNVQVTIATDMDCIANSATGQVLFNIAGVCDGDSGLTYNPTTDELTAGSFVGPLSGNVTSTGQSRFSGSLLIPAKADPGSPVTNELWRSTTSPVGLKWYDGATIQRAIKDSDFSGTTGVLNRINSTTYSILAPVVGGIISANTAGTDFVVDVMEACGDTGGQHANWTAALGWHCGNTSTGGLSGLTSNIVPVATSATSIGDSSAPQIKTNAGTLEIGNVGTNSVSFDASAVTGAKEIVIPNEDGTLMYAASTATLTNKTIVASGAGGTNTVTLPLKAYWPSPALTLPSGSTCTKAAVGAINSGPSDEFVSCSDAATSIFEGQVRLDRTVTTVTFSITLNDSDSSSHVFSGNFIAMCRGNTDTVNSTWGSSAGAVSITMTTASVNYVGTSGATTPNGTCDSDSTLFWKFTVDNAGAHTDANGRIIGVLLAQAS